jgi:hypothetical protein
MISVTALIVATLSQYDSSYLRGQQMHGDGRRQVLFSPTDAG